MYVCICIPPLVGIFVPSQWRTLVHFDLTIYVVRETGERKQNQGTILSSDTDLCLFFLFTSARLIDVNGSLKRRHKCAFYAHNHAAIGPYEICPPDCSRDLFLYSV